MEPWKRSLVASDIAATGLRVYVKEKLNTASLCIQDVIHDHMGVSCKFCDMSSK